MSSIRNKASLPKALGGARHIPGPDPRAAWGHFGENGRVFRVTSTDTPRPWINLIHNGDYGAFFSQHGLGYSFFRSPKTCEITRWSLNDSRPRLFDAGRLVFVKDIDSGRYWPGNPQPGEGDRYRAYFCDHSPGWSRIEAERDGILFSFLFFLPLSGHGELWTVGVTNRSRRSRRLALVPVVELPTRSTYLGSRGEYDRRLHAIRCFQPGDALWKRMDTRMFFGLDAKVFGWDTSLEDFLGPRADRLQPAALESGLRNSQADTEWMVAALETRAELEPGQTFAFNVMLGYAEHDDDARAFLARYRRANAVEAALKTVVADWDLKLSRGRCDLPDRHASDFLSVWGKNAMTQATRCSRGKTVGYRDTAQDLRGYLLVDPEFVETKMLWLFAHVHRDGHVYRGIDPWCGRHDKDDYRDNPVWMAELLNATVKETGRLDVLDKTVPYLDGGQGSVWDHLVRILRRLVRLRGARGLVRVGGGDWNDALGPFGREGRGESAWLTLLVARGLRLAAELAEASGRQADRRRLVRWRRDLVAAFNRTAWDGAWYIYGWDDDGVPIGSRRSPEGKIHANVQTWALMERVVPPAREKKLWASIRKYLETDAGLLTCWPAYVKTQPTGARIAEVNPGWCENAAIYCHGTAFYMAACLAAGQGDAAFRALEAFLPTNPLNPRCDMEPFAVANFYVGPDSRHFGRAGYSWFTGSVAWFLAGGWEGLVGLQPDFDGMRIAPCPPRAWTRWRAVRVFRGATLDIVFRKRKGATGLAVRKLVVDGRPLDGNIIPPLEPGRHTVNIELA